MPVIALEFVRDEWQVMEIVEDLTAEKIRKLLKLDFVFILLYVALFVALGYLILEVLPEAYFLGIAVCLCVAGAALFDIVENFLLFSVLRRANRRTVDRIRRAALTKWALFFVAMGLLAVTLAWQGDRFVVAFFYLNSASVGALSLWRHPLVQWFRSDRGLADANRRSDPGRGGTDVGLKEVRMADCGSLGVRPPR